MIRKEFENQSYQNDDYSRFAGPEYFGKGPRDYKRSDARIFEDVCEALLNDSQVDASNIEVEVSRGLVTLRGSVESRQMKKDAENCIEVVTGVEDIMNLLRIRQFVDGGAEGLVKKQARLQE